MVGIFWAPEFLIDLLAKDFFHFLAATQSSLV
jgi:hypothetical protein